jgi:hypothetical protein
MEEDKKIQSLLTKYAVQEPSAGFEDKVMQLITASEKTPVTPFISSLLNRLLLTLFLIVTVALLVTSFFLDPKILMLHISIITAPDVYRQLFTFFAVFWIVMLVNTWWNKRKSIVI